MCANKNGSRKYTHTVSIRQLKLKISETCFHTQKLTHAKLRRTKLQKKIAKKRKNYRKKRNEKMANRKWKTKEEKPMQRHRAKVGVKDEMHSKCKKERTEKHYINCQPLEGILIRWKNI